MCENVCRCVCVCERSQAKPRTYSRTIITSTKSQMYIHICTDTRTTLHPDEQKSLPPRSPLSLRDLPAPERSRAVLGFGGVRRTEWWAVSLRHVAGTPNDVIRAPSAVWAARDHAVTMATIAHYRQWECNKKIKPTECNHQGRLGGGGNPTLARHPHFSSLTQPLPPVFSFKIHSSLGSLGSQTVAAYPALFSLTSEKMRHLELINHPVLIAQPFYSELSYVSLSLFCLLFSFFS